MKEIATGAVLMVVIDSSVLVDMFVVLRPRHPQAYRLREYLDRQKIEIRAPMHTLLELRSAINQEHRGVRPAGEWWPNNLTQGRPLPIFFIPIDERFIREYLDPAIPHMRAGDYPFVAIAKREGLALITEDKEQREIGMLVGVKTFSTLEYLAAVGA